MGGAQTKEPYSVPIEGTKTNEKESHIYRSPVALQGLLEGPEPEVRTMQDVYRTGAQRYADKGFLGTRKQLEDGKFGPYDWRTYAECFEIAKNLGASIIQKNLVEKIKEYQDYELQMIAIYSKNREEWILLDEACSLYGITSVPIYDTLGPEAVQFVFDQTNLTTVCLTANYVEALSKSAKLGKTNKLKNLVIFDIKNLKEEARQLAQEVNFQIFDFWQLVEEGKQANLEFPKINPNDIYSFSYTSGTTGIPKAVMISHRNMVSTIGGASRHQDLLLRKEVVYLSYLPLAHVLERIVYGCIAYYGAYYGFFNGDVQKLKEDIAELKPHVFTSVPRLFNRFHDAIKAGFDKVQGVKKQLVSKAIDSKLYYFRNNAQVSYKFYDKIVFNKVKDQFGGRLQLLISGGAPLSGEVADFLRICLSCPLIEGYGQTESTGASFVSRSNDNFSAHVGGPLGQTEFKLRSVDEMDYSVNDVDEEGRPAPRGELLVRGPGITQGYYKEDEKTKETIDSEGWLSSGDIVRVDYEGRIKIIDRKKNILKLQQGEYVAPEKIEGVYVRHKLISEAYIYGDSFQSHLVGIFVPDPKQFTKFAQENNIQGTLEELCQNQALKDLFKKEIDTFAKKEKLYGFEMAKHFHIDPVSFQNNDLYTPSFKIKRNDAKKFYQNVLNDLYKLPA